jgi:hypothetical protein
MANVALASLDKIIKVAQEIKDIIDTIERNSKECDSIERCVADVSFILQQLDRKKVTAAMRRPLEGIAESFDQALRLVKEWKKTNSLCKFFGAKDMKTKLDGVQKEIEINIRNSMLAMHVQSFLKNQELDAQVRIGSLISIGIQVKLISAGYNSLIFSCLNLFDEEIREILDCLKINKTRPSDKVSRTIPRSILCYGSEFWKYLML